MSRNDALAPLATLAIGFWIVGCGGVAAPAESEGPAGEVEERLAATREQLREDDRRTPPPVSRRRAAAPASKVVPESVRAEPPADEVEPARPSAAPPLPDHLSRRERMTRACYRDTFGVVDPAHLRILLAREREFCRCLVDTIVSTRVAASLQDALIEDFKANRQRVEQANPEFNRQWHRCKM